MHATAAFLACSESRTVSHFGICEIADPNSVKRLLDRTAICTVMNQMPHFRAAGDSLLRRDGARVSRNGMGLEAGHIAAARGRRSHRAIDHGLAVGAGR